MNFPNAAIIIPTCNRPETLKQCLRKLVPCVRKHPECTIFVGDDGDASNTRSLLDEGFDCVNVVQGPRRGPAANRNYAAAQSVGDLLIFIDDDCIPDDDLIAEYQRAALVRPECDVFEGRITALGPIRSFADVVPVNETGGYLWSCNFAIRRSLFERVGGFDERYPFPAMEDVDLRFRLRGRTQIEFLPRAKVFHAVERRFGWRRQKHTLLSLVLYLQIHGLSETGMSPINLARGFAATVYRFAVRALKREAAEDVGQAFLLIWANFLLIVIAVFWRFRLLLARAAFPACCAGCRSIHASLAGRRSSMT